MSQFSVKPSFIAKYGRFLLAALLCLGLAVACGRNGESTPGEASQPRTLEELLASAPEPRILQDDEVVTEEGLYQVTSRGRPVQIFLTAEDEGYLRLHFGFPANPEAAGELEDGPLALLRPPLGRFAADQPWIMTWRDEALWLYAPAQGVVSFHPNPQRQSVDSSLRDLELDQQNVPASVLTAAK